MNKQKLSYIVVSSITVVALISYAAYLLVGLYPDVLITAQDRNIFSNDYMFFSQQISRPFGLFQYIGAYLTQFFYYPALGAAMLIAIWTASAFVGIKAFKLKGLWRSMMIVPAAGLLASMLDLGYWVYCLNIPGYWFSQSVAFLSLMLILWAANTTPRRFRLVWYVVVGFALFPVFGWISYLFTFCLALSQFSKDEKTKTYPSWMDLVGIALTCAAPFVFKFVYEGLQFHVVYNAGFPFFKTASDESLRPTIPFFYLIGAVLIASIARILPTLKKVPACASYVVVGIVSSYFVWTTIFKDDNYHYEIQMTQATMDDDWQKVISVAEKTKTPSRTMVMLKNIALMNTGELGSRSYELGNNGIEIYNPDSLNLNTMHIAAPTIYYNYGKMNYSMRWSMEFSVPYGFSPYYLKNLARCADMTGEKKLVERYTSRLNSMTFYSDWTPAPASKVVKELYRVFPDALDSDDNNCERYIISNFSKAYISGNPLVSDLALFYSTLVRDAALFCVYFTDYVKSYKGETLPIGYEEALCLFAERFPERFPENLKITPETASNYKQFMSDGNTFSQYAPSEKALGQQMFESWGGTYWWFNAFGRNAY